MIEIKDIVIPLVTGFVAAWLTHTFTLRQARAELLLRERVAAFNDLHAKLVGLMRVCEVRVAEIRGAEFGPLTSDTKGIVEYLNELQALEDHHFVYFPKAVLIKLQEIKNRTALMASFELRCASDPEAPEHRMPEYFEALAELLDDTIEVIHSHNPLGGGWLTRLTTGTSRRARLRRSHR